VFAHVARGELAEASALLDGERYATLKAAYADGMSAFLAQLDQAADAVEAEQRGAVERSWPRVWLVVGSLVASWALMFGGVVRSEHARAAAEARLAREREAWAASRRGAAPAPVLADASRPDGPPPDGARASSPSLDPGGLPVLAPESATALLLERLRTRAAPLRVLVVEDNAANRIVATAMLRTFEKVATTVAVDGFAALEAITEARFDVVLMDIHMPELDGLETTRRLRALGGEAARTPVIAMTASAFDSDVAACAAAGLEGFLAKPYRREDLAAALLPWVTIVHDDAT
jgi:CheY-like chemotaxis protein